MSGAAKVIFDVTNLTAIASVVPTGIIFAQGQSKRGELNNPREIINSWPRFVELYGGLMPDNDTPLLVKRYLEKGGRIRFSRVGSTAENAGEKAVSSYGTSLSLTAASGGDIGIKSGANTFDSEFTTASEYYNDIEAYFKTLPGFESFVKVKNNVGNSVDSYLLFTTTDPNFIDAVGLTVTDSKDSFTVLKGGVTTQAFEIESSFEGSDYNNVYVTTSAPKNGKSGFFNINVIHRTEPTLNVTYDNKQLVGTESVDKINDPLVKFNILDQGLDNSMVLNGPTALSLTGGKDAVPQLTDYIGDSTTLNGFHSFDDYDDSYYLVTLDDVDVDISGAAYVENRKDITYITKLDGITKQTLIEEKDTKNIDSKFVYFVGSGGGIEVIDPLTSSPKLISPLADILANAVNSDNANGPWYSFAGPNRGILTNVIKVNKNFGTQSTIKDLDELADERINMVINRNASIKLWGNFSAQTLNNQEKYFNVVKLIIFLQKALRPILEQFLEEPNDIPTWQSMYYSVRPLLESLKSRRAIYNWDWSGDQFAKSMEDLKVNKVTDVTQGKYKAILAISAITSLQEISIGIYMTEAGLELEVINELNQ